MEAFPSLKDVKARASDRGIDVEASYARFQSAIARGEIPKALADILSAPDPEPLVTERQRDVLLLMADGLTVDEIAERLHLSRNTVMTHQRKAYARLKARSGIHAVAIALRTGLIS